MNNVYATGTAPAQGDLRKAFKKVHQVALRQKFTKVLVIEDDTLTRLMLCRVLRDMGYVTIDAGNGHTGMEMFRTEQPDLIVTDILMPDKEGLETIMEIRAADADIPIVAMSGGGGMQGLSFLAMAKKFGASRTIAKPFTPEKLEEILDSFMIGNSNPDVGLYSSFESA